MKKSLICGVWLVALSATVTGGMRAARAEDENPRIAPPQSLPHGRSYGEWQAEWWKWAFSIPTAQNPILDPDGTHCAVGQTDHVWFLAGTFGGPAVTRRCTIPAGTALFFPLFNLPYVGFLTDPPVTRDELLEQGRMFVDPAMVSATIDGRPVVDPRRYQAASPLFACTFPPDNIFGIDNTICAQTAGGNLTCTPCFDIGYYLFVAPLPPGRHTIHFTASNPVFPGFQLDVTYDLVVAD